MVHNYTAAEDKGSAVSSRMLRLEINAYSLLTRFLINCLFPSQTLTWLSSLPILMQEYSGGDSVATGI